MVELIVDHTASDFANAIRALLPNGQYWQDAENEELRRLIEGMGDDFKITHDEIQLSLLADFNDELFGWRLSDYTALLFTQAGKDTGRVYDQPSKPNLIFVSLANNVRSESAWREFEEKRLPHTSIQWIYTGSADLHVQVASARYVFNQHKHKVIS